MGWLSLVPRVVATLWRGGAQATSAIWSGSKKAVVTSVKATSAAASVGLKGTEVAVKHPVATLAVGTGAYAGWKALSDDDKSLGTALGETIREETKAVGGFTHDTINGITGEDTVEKVTQGTTETISKLTGTVNETKGMLGTIGDSLSGIAKFLGNMFGGNGMNIFSNFFNNIGSGNISGLGIGALIASSYLIFGRTGMLGKIGGALLAMMMIGNHSQQQQQSVTQPLSDRQTPDLETAPQRHFRP